MLNMVSFQPHSPAQKLADDALAEGKLEDFEILTPKQAKNQTVFEKLLFVVLTNPSDGTTWGGYSNAQACSLLECSDRHLRRYRERVRKARKLTGYNIGAWFEIEDPFYRAYRLFDTYRLALDGHDITVLIGIDIDGNTEVFQLGTRGLVFLGEE